MAYKAGVSSENIHKELKEIKDLLNENKADV